MLVFALVSSNRKEVYDGGHKRIHCFGWWGGGVYRVARFLKNIRPNITTIQTVFDHGGHSGELRDERGILPPGDLRQAILALSDNNMEPSLRQLMSYRFPVNGNSSLDRATVGNILLTALTEIRGSLPLAINDLCKLCGVRGKVLPVSLDEAELCAILSDGEVVKGEDKIDTRSVGDNRTIDSVYLDKMANIYIDSYDALVSANKIVFCPGDLYTSLIPNILVKGFVDALKKSNAKIIYCVNIMTKKAETHNYTVDKFVAEMLRYLGGCKIATVVFNSGSIDPRILDKYELEKSYPVAQGNLDLACDGSYLAVNLVDETGGVVRHHQRIASVIADI